MAPAQLEPGTVIRRTLDDGFTYYGRILESPWVAFYDLRTQDRIDQPEQVVGHPVLFTVTVDPKLLARRGWRSLGQVPLDDSVRPPQEQFIQDQLDPSNCEIVDRYGNSRDATPEECEGLEPVAVWHPEHIADRLMDHYAGRPNVWLESMRLRRD